jgi:6-phosphogluconolactonase
MLYKIPWKTFLLCTGSILFLCSCSTARILLAGSAHIQEGGIYVLSEGKEPERCLRVPTLNYLIRSSKNPTLLYGTLGRHLTKKSRYGAVGIFREGKNRKFTLLQCFSVSGRTPCHLTLSPDGKFLYTANYSSGDISELPLDERGLVSGKVRLIPHSGRSVTPRQKGPHPHFVSFDPAGKQLYVCDLGTDEIRIYDYIPEKGIQLPCREILKLPPGSGVRHLTFAPDGKTLYTANELNSTSSAFIRKGTTWKRGQTLSTRQKPSGIKNYPGAIRIMPDGKYFLLTNRGENSIALFETAPGGKFTLLETIPSGGNYPSDILLFPDGKCFAVIHLKSHNVTLFELDTKKKRLLPEKESFRIPQGMTLTL